MQTHLKKFQRELRRHMPYPEYILWKRIRKNQLGIKFRRQYVYGNRIFDFYAPQKKLAIEIDGETHFINLDRRTNELEYDKFLRDKGITVMRFSNKEVTHNIMGVLQAIGEMR